MRILVADQNALLLAAIARAFGRHCEVVVATRRDVCVAHIEERKLDVVVACEKLHDYTGLELLGEVTALSPRTLRIFSARPETLKRLGHQLDFFGLLGTLSYPIDPRKLLLALKVAREKLAAAHPKPPKPKVRHVVLEESEWDTGVRLGLLERELEAEAARAAASEGETEVAQGDSAEALASARVPRHDGQDESADHAWAQDANLAGKGGEAAVGYSGKGWHSAAWDVGADASSGSTERVGSAHESGKAPAGSAGRRAAARPAGDVARLAAEAPDVRVTDSAAWETRPSQGTADDAGNTRTKSMASPTSGVGLATDHATAAAVARAGEAAVDVSFDDMPGAIAIARVAPRSTGQSAGVGAARADEPRAAEVTSPEKAPRQDVRVEPAPRSPPRPSAASLRHLGTASNDPDIDEPLPVETHGAANEPLFDNAPGKGGVRFSSSSARPNTDATLESRAHEAQDVSKTPAAVGAHAAEIAAAGTRGSQGASSGRETTERGADDGGSGARGGTQSAGAAVGQARGDEKSAGASASGAAGSRGGAQSGGVAGARGSKAAGGGAAAGAKNGAAKGPKVRKPTVPTAAQREAFQRALARRNAARRGGGFAEDGFGPEARDFGGDDLGALSAGVRIPGATANGARAGGTAHSSERATPFISMSSLSDLAKMASTKRPLKEFKRGTQQPRRKAIVYGSGVAAALLAVVIFQLLKGGHHHNGPVQDANAHVFGPTSTLVADGAAAGPPPQPFAPTPPAPPMPAPGSGAAGLPQAQHFDPNTAPPDPPPPPAVEHPGPIEPPSAHVGPPLGMQGSSDE